MSTCYLCKNCNKLFSRKDNLKRHIQNQRCKELKNSNKKRINELEKKFNNLLKEFSIIKLENATLKEQNIFIITLLNNKSNNKNINISNLKNSSVNIDNSDKKYITINIYGQEKYVPNNNNILFKNIDNLKNEELLKYLIHYKHLNSPNNRNIYVNNDECQVKRIKGWVKESCEKFLKGEFMKNMTKHMIDINSNILNYKGKTNNNLIDLFESDKSYYKNIKNYLYKNKHLVEEAKSSEN